jgi:hypothetical protein
VDSGLAVRASCQRALRPRVPILFAGASSIKAASSSDGGAGMFSSFPAEAVSSRAHSLATNRMASHARMPAPAAPGCPPHPLRAATARGRHRGRNARRGGRRLPRQGQNPHRDFQDTVRHAASEQERANAAWVEACASENPSLNAYHAAIAVSTMPAGLAKRG